MGVVLCLDTCLEACSVSLVTKAGKKAITLSEDMTRGQSERLVPMIEEMLREAKRTYQDITAIAATRGPGSFTGLRIGMTTASVLAHTLSVPFHGFTCFQAMAACLKDEEDGCLVIDSKRRGAFAHMFKSGALTGKPFLLPEEDFSSQTAVFGFYGHEAVVPIGKSSLCEALGELALDETVKSAQSPFYMREADISVSKKQIRTLDDNLIKRVKL